MAAIDLMEANLSSLRHSEDFKVAAMSSSAGELTDEIKKHIADFMVECKLDFRQRVTELWARSIDDSAAQEWWGWRPSCNLDAMMADMLEKLMRRFEEEHL